MVFPLGSANIFTIQNKTASCPTANLAEGAPVRLRTLQGL